MEGRGRSATRDPIGAGTSKDYFNHQGCKKGKDCNFDHKFVSEKETKKIMVLPSRSGSPGKGKGEKGGGRGSSAGAGGAKGAGGEEALDLTDNGAHSS